MSNNNVPLAHRIAELAKRIKKLSEQLVTKVTKEVYTNDRSKHSKESK
jgi:hypothetical protein